MTATVTPIQTELVPEIVMIPVHQLIGDDNIRHKLGDLAELTESVRNIGVVEPLIVTWIEPPEGFKGEPGYRIAAGHRRHAAAMAAKQTYVPCIVRELSDGDRIALMIAENMRRQGLTPLEEAQAFFRAIEAGITKKDLAKKVGVKEQYLTDRLGLLALPGAALDKLDGGTLSVTQAGWLLKLKDLPNFAKAVAECLKLVDDQYRNFSEHNVTAIVQKYQRDIKVAELVAGAKQRGWMIFKGQSAHIDADKGVLVSKLGIEKKVLTAHKKLDCHGLLIVSSTYDGVKGYDVCTNPTSHTEPDTEQGAKVPVDLETVTKATTSPSPWYGGRVELTEEEKAAKATREARHNNFLGSVALGKPKAEKIAALIEQLAGEADDDEAVYFDIELERDERGFVNRAQAQVKVREYAARSASNQIAVAYSTLLTCQARRAPDKLAWLVSLGYEPDEAEQAELDATAAADVAYQAKLDALPEPIRTRLTEYTTRETALGVESGLDEWLYAVREAFEENDTIEGTHTSIDALLDQWQEQLAEAEPDGDEEGGEGKEGAVGTYAGDEDHGDEITSGVEPDFEANIDPDEADYDGDDMDAAELLGEEHQANLE